MDWLLLTIKCAEEGWLAIQRKEMGERAAIRTRERSPPPRRHVSFAVDAVSREPGSGGAPLTHRAMLDALARCEGVSSVECLTSLVAQAYARRFGRDGLPK